MLISNNKNNVYYKELQDAINDITNVRLSLGTLHKFFYNDNNLMYEIGTIEIINQFVIAHNTVIIHKKPDRDEIGPIVNSEIEPIEEISMTGLNEGNYFGETEEPSYPETPLHNTGEFQEGNENQYPVLKIADLTFTYIL